MDNDENIIEIILFLSFAILIIVAILQLIIMRIVFLKNNDKKQYSKIEYGGLFEKYLKQYFIPINYIVVSILFYGFTFYLLISDTFIPVKTLCVFAVAKIIVGLFLLDKIAKIISELKEYNSNLKYNLEEKDKNCRIWIEKTQYWQDEYKKLEHELKEEVKLRK